MKTLLGAVDVGRSQVKSASQNVNFKFPTVLTKQQEVTDIVQFDKNEFPAIVTISGITYYLGNTALLRTSTSCFNLGESEGFHEASIIFILYSVAKMVYSKVGRQSCYSDGVRVALAINLTFLNSQFSKKYAEALKKHHKVIIYPDNKQVEVRFEVFRLFSFYQGYVSIFNYYNTDLNLTGLPCLCVDVGCYTTDISLIKDFTLVQGRSFNFGSGQIIEQLIASAAKQGISLDFYTTDNYVCEHRGKISALSGAGIDVTKEFTTIFMNDAVPKLYQLIINFIGSSPVAHIFMCGGLAYLLEYSG